MALAGTLRDFGLPDIVQLIGLQRKTGILHLATEGETVKVIFEGGNIVAAESSLTRPSDRIGNALVMQGAIAQDQLDRALGLQKQTMQRLGHVLISENLVSEDHLRKAVEAQLFQVVFRLFRWREGNYSFDAQNTVDYERTGAVSLGADFVLMEGIRMVDEWPIIERRIPSMAAVFKRVVDSSQVQSKAADDGDLSLSGDELLVFNAVNGKRTCQQIVESTPLHDFAVCRTLLDLMDRDVVALTDLKGSTSGPKVGKSTDSMGMAFMAVAILAALFGVYRNLASPFGILGLPPLIRPAVNSAIATRLRERLELVDARVRGFRLAHGRLPVSVDELVAEGLATKASVQGIQLSASETGFTVEATGPEGPVRIGRLLTPPPPSEAEAEAEAEPDSGAEPGIAGPEAAPTASPSN